MALDPSTQLWLARFTKVLRPQCPMKFEHLSSSGCAAVAPEKPGYHMNTVISPNTALARREVFLS